MIFWAILSPDGLLPEKLGASAALPDGAVLLPKGMTPAEAAKCQHFDGDWWPRPQSPAVQAVGGRIRIDHSPKGAKVEVIDADLWELLAEVSSENDVIEIELPDPGRYRVIVDFGLPWLSTATDIEVT